VLLRSLLLCLHFLRTCVFTDCCEHYRLEIPSTDKRLICQPSEPFKSQAQAAYFIPGDNNTHTHTHTIALQFTNTGNKAKLMIVPMRQIFYKSRLALPVAFALTLPLPCLQQSSGCLGVEERVSVGPACHRRILRVPRL
jgi:hypothetical protein